MPLPSEETPFQVTKVQVDLAALDHVDPAVVQKAVDDITAAIATSTNAAKVLGIVANVVASVGGLIKA
jgi:hypothetical protein